MTSTDKDHATSFGCVADLYAQARPQYPAAVFEALTAKLQGPRRRAVDLGAGGGQAAAALTAYFDHVTAVEPDRRMTEKIAANKRLDIQNVTAEDAQFAAGRIDAVIAATAFHWMDQPAVCAKAHQWLRGGGVFFPFSFDAFSLTGEAARAMAPHVDKWSAYKDQRLVEKFDYAAAIRASALFTSVERFDLHMRKEMATADAARLFATTSFARAYAADQGIDDAYPLILRDALAEAAQMATVEFPIIGAVAVK